MILVILVHSGFCGPKFTAFASSIALSIFFMLSGLLASYQKETLGDLKTLLKKKVKHIFLPYVYFSLIQLAIHGVEMLCGVYTGHDMIQSLIDTLILHGDSVMWFLPALFIGQILFHLLIRRTGGFVFFGVTLFLGVISVICYLGLYPLLAAADTALGFAVVSHLVLTLLRGVFCMSLVALGYCIGALAITFDSFWRSRLKTLLIAVLCLAGQIPIALQNGNVDIRILHLKSIPLFYLSATLGSCGLVFLCVGLWDLFGNGANVRWTPFLFKPFVFWGRNSLIIMCTHLSFYILFLGIRYAFLMDRFVKHGKSYIFLFNLVLSVMVMETPVILLINRFFPFLLGRRRDKK